MCDRDFPFLISIDFKSYNEPANSSSIKMHTLYLLRRVYINVPAEDVTAACSFIEVHGSRLCIYANVSTLANSHDVLAVQAAGAACVILTADQLFYFAEETPMMFHDRVCVLVTWEMRDEEDEREFIRDMLRHVRDWKNTDDVGAYFVELDRWDCLLFKKGGYRFGYWHLYPGLLELPEGADEFLILESIKTGYPILDVNRLCTGAKEEPGKFSIAHVIWHIVNRIHKPYVGEIPSENDYASTPLIPMDPCRALIIDEEGEKLDSSYWSTEETIAETLETGKLVFQNTNGMKERSLYEGSKELICLKYKPWNQKTGPWFVLRDVENILPK